MSETDQQTPEADTFPRIIILTSGNSEYSPGSCRGLLLSEYRIGQHQDSALCGRWDTVVCHRELKVQLVLLLQGSCLEISG